ncbi:hypothetical protein JRO89_XS12G0030500 [Xanthoceras sorbifolium]|uniref:Protein kinase domain-containing protein n=1 Tax=Xanthoceras sorbifolium TaxID=99658 RepID=A0ABQ8HAT4_9ROSI|nr:hypothetical protein JRO89_XS12G0030500 [Xanthoceras sorbifolium]
MKFSFCCSSNSVSVSQPTTKDTSRQGAQNDGDFRVFSYNELKTATHGFSTSNKIGAGASGSVYKGRLRDGTIVAVKVLSIELESMKGEREFVSELAALSNMKHENLVTLQGCCIDGASRYLVYDYMENNSLAHTLLVFFFSCNHKRKRGYLAPEYAITGHLTRKSDVYSFGVLLLEIISGRPFVDFDLEQGEHYLVQKAWEVYKDSDLVTLVDPTLDVNYPEAEAVRFLKVGLLCVQENVRLRPIMSTTVNMLTGDVDIQDVHITQPGLADLMDIKLAQQMLSQSISSSETPSHSTAYF